MIINIHRYRKYNKYYYRLSSPYFLKHDLTAEEVKKQLSYFFDSDLNVRFKDINKALRKICVDNKFNVIWKVVFSNDKEN